MCATTRHNGETQTQDHKYGQNEISILGTPSWLWDNIASKPSILILSLITSTASSFLPPNNIHSILVRAWMLATCQLEYHRVLIYVSLKIHRNSLGVMWCGVAVDFVTQDKTRQEVPCTSLWAPAKKEKQSYPNIKFHSNQLKRANIKFSEIYIYIYIWATSSSSQSVWTVKLASHDERPYTQHHQVFQQRTGWIWIWATWSKWRNEGRKESWTKNIF